MCNAWCLDFAKASLQFWPAEPAVLEVGARDVNGSVRAVCATFTKSYLGVDIEKGSGVDAIVNANHLVENLGADSFDIVISTEMIEHVLDWPNGTLPDVVSAQAEWSSGPHHTFDWLCSS